MVAIYPDKVLAIPASWEGWDAWSLWDVRNFIGVLLGANDNEDRARGFGPTLDQAAAELFLEPFPLTSLERQMKLRMIEFVGHRLPKGWTTDTLRTLWEAIANRPPGPWEAAASGAAAGVQVLAQGAQEGGERVAALFPDFTDNKFKAGAATGSLGALGLMGLLAYVAKQWR